MQEEGQIQVAETAKMILVRWLVEHGYQSPSFLNSRCLEVEYLIESTRFASNDSRTESEYDEMSTEYGESDEDSNDETTDPDSPEPPPIKH